MGEAPQSPENAQVPFNPNECGNCGRCGHCTRPQDDHEWCRRCGGPNVIWSCQSPLWNYVMRGNDINGESRYRDLVCIACFIICAVEAGLPQRGWRLTLDPEPEGLIYITPSGRRWDPERFLWVEPDLAHMVEVSEDGVHVCRVCGYWGMRPPPVPCTAPRELGPTPDDTPEHGLSWRDGLVALDALLNDCSQVGPDHANFVRISAVRDIVNAVRRYEDDTDESIRQALWEDAAADGESWTEAQS